MRVSILIVGIIILFAFIAKAPFTSQRTLEKSRTPTELIEKSSSLSLHIESSTTEEMISLSSPSSEPAQATTATTTTVEKVVRTYTEDTLREYDGQNMDLPIYIAFEGNVYDVTAGKEFYQPGGKYHFLAGTDGTNLLKMFGGDLIKKKYPIIGTYSQKPQ